MGEVAGRSLSWTCVCMYQNIGPICTHCGKAEQPPKTGRTLPDLDLWPSIPCGDEDCTGNVAGDGTSWWCESCGGTWDADGTGGRVTETARTLTPNEKSNFSMEHETPEELDGFCHVCVHCEKEAGHDGDHECECEDG